MASTPRRKGMAATVIANKTSELLQETSKPQLIDEIINEELQSMKVVDIPIEELYSAPAKWNEWNRLPEEKLIQLCQSLVEIGQQAPCIVWKIDKVKVLSLYDSGEPDAYGFVGEKYMLLSGHNRAFARKLIGATVEHSDDEAFQVCPCIAYDEQLSEEFVEKAKQIIDDTNYLSRDKTVKETMRAIVKKYQQFDQTKKRQSENVAVKIAESLDMDKRTVLRYQKIKTNLLPKIQEFLFDEKISFNDAISLSEYNSEVQEYLYEAHRNIFTNKRELKQFFKKTTKDMTISQVQEILNVEEQKVSFETVTVSVPREHLDEFNEMVRQWKSNLVK